MKKGSTGLKKQSENWYKMLQNWYKNIPPLDPIICGTKCDRDK